MEYTSFYGGRKGASFIIVKKFSSVQEMVNNFKLGNEYTAVNYEEYVIISTENLNDKDNGKLYKRGNDYENDMGGAIYIGQIVGPSGPAPNVVMTTIADVEEKASEEGAIASSGTYAPVVNLVPGAKGTIGNRTFDTTTDSIQWESVSIRDADAKDSKVYVGFKFPYTITDYVATSVSPYTNGAYSDNVDIEKIDDGTHPFYAKWRLKIPKGIKGDSLKNLKVVTATNDIQQYEGQADDVANQRKVLIYEQVSYDNSEAGTVIKTYLGDYNMIEDIDIDNDGTITIQYTHDDDVVYSKLLKFIDTVVIADNGKITITYNDGTSYEGWLRFISDITMAETGELTKHYSTGGSATLPTKLNYIKDTKINGAQHLLVLYSDPAKQGSITYEGVSGYKDLGYIGNGTVGSVAGTSTDTDVQAIVSSLPANSTWFIVDEVTVND